MCCKEICLHLSVLRQSQQQQHYVKARPPRFPNKAVTAHSLHKGADAIIVVVPALASCLRLGAGSFLGGTGGTIGVWVVVGAQPTVPEQVMCHIGGQRARVGAHLGRNPVELALGWWRSGARECRHTSD